MLKFCVFKECWQCYDRSDQARSTEVSECLPLRVGMTMGLAVSDGGMVVRGASMRRTSPRPSWRLVKWVMVRRSLRPRSL